MKKFFIGLLTVVLIGTTSVAHAGQGDWSPDRPVRVTGPTAVGFDYNVFNSFIQHRQLAQNIRFQSDINSYGDERDFVVAKIKNWGNTPYFHTLSNLKKGDRIWIQGYVHNSARETTSNQFTAQNVRVKLDWTNPQEVVSTISADNADSVTDIVSLRFQNSGLSISPVGAVEADYGNPRQTKTLPTTYNGSTSTSSIPQVFGSYKGDHIIYWEFEVVDATPDIAIDKTDQNGQDQDGVQGNDTQTINEGAHAGFKITVTNTGTEALKNVVISDPEAPDCNRTASQTQSLYPGSTFAPGASFTYNCRRDNVTSTTFADGKNDISVDAKGAGSNMDVTDSDHSHVVTLNVDPGAIEILKWADNPNDNDGKPTGGNNTNDSQSVRTGANAIFKIQVKNIGPVALQDVVVNDPAVPRCALNANQVREILTTGTSSKSSITNVNKLGGTNNNNTLEPNEGFQYNCSEPNILDTFTNIADTHGDPVNGQPRVNDNDPTRVIICDRTNDCPEGETDPEITIDKIDVNTNDQDGVQRNDTQTIDSGEQAVFEITVTNTGRDALQNVVVTDPEAPDCNRNANQTRNLYPGNLFDRGESFTYTCVRDAVGSSTFADGDNDIQVTGVGLVTGLTVSDQDDSAVVVITGPICGDGVVEPPEQCDLGADNGKPGKPCSSTCTIVHLPACTNAQFDPNAVRAGDSSVFNWSTANISGNVDLRCGGSSGFTLSETVPANGSRTVTVPATATLGSDTQCEIFEVGKNISLCDDILHTRNAICGDGLQEPPEQCDDGNTVNGDGCSSTCTLEPACVGTPFFNPDKVGSNATSVFSWDTANTGTNVTLNCSGPAIVNFSETVPSNGTRSIDTRIGATNGDTATCRLQENGVNIPTCSNVLEVDTSLPFCTDGIINQPSEQCDDGNTNNDDACSNECKINVPPHAIDVLKWARNDNDKDGVTTGSNADNDSQTVESITDNNLDKAVFRIKVTNVGTNPLKNVRVQDTNAPVCALSQAEVREILNTGTLTKTGISGVALQNEVTRNDLLEPGEGFVYNCTQPDIRDAFTNTAKAIGEAVDDSETVNDTDDSIVIVDNQCVEPNCPTPGDAAITIDKIDENPSDFDNTQGDDSQLIGENSTAVFRITVTNTGGEALKSVVISDDEAPNCAKTAAETQALYPGTHFDIGETFTYTCDKPNAVTGDFDGANGQGAVNGANDARVDAESAVDNDPVHDEDSSVVVFIAQCTPAQGQISILKDDSTPGLADTDGDDTQVIASGGTAEFTITVANIGTTSIEDVSVEDALSPSCAKTTAEFMALLGAVGDNDDKLDPGETVEYTCTQSSVTASFTNSATVNGRNPAIPCTVTDTDTTEVVVSSTPGFCGDGIIQAPEECDNGPLNGTAGNQCLSNCVLDGGDTCTNPPCGGGTGVPTPSVGVCDVHPSTFAPVCSQKKADNTVLTDPDWIAYRECAKGNVPPIHPISTGMSIAEACTLDYMAAKGESKLCGANIGGVIDPFADPTNAEVAAQCGICLGAGCSPVIPRICTPMPTPCAGCFKANTGITKVTLTPIVAANERATFEIDVVLDGFDYNNYEVVGGHVRVYDHIVSTESGNMWYREGIIDGDDNETWVWCGDTANSALCGGDTGEYFRLNLTGPSWNYLNPINNAGRADLMLPYDVNTMVWGAFDTSRVVNSAYAVVYYDYVNLDPITGLPVGTPISVVGGIGDNACDSTIVVNQLSFASVGDNAVVDIIRPFVQARAGNAGYFTDAGETDKAFGDQQAIYNDTSLLTPTVLNQGVTITGNTNLDVFEGEQMGDADEFQEFQDQKEAFYDNIESAMNNTRTFGVQSFDRVGDTEVYQLNSGDLNVATVAGITKSATFIIKDGDVIVENDFSFAPGVFAAFIIRNGNLLIKDTVKSMEGMYLVESGDDPTVSGEIKSMNDAVSYEQLKVSGNLYGDLGHLLSLRRYIGTGPTIEPSIEINFDVRLLEHTPPMLQQFLGEGWREAVQQ